MADIAAANRVTAVLHEFDPVLLSTVPPKGDVDLDEAFFASSGSLRNAKRAGKELDWATDMRGMLSEDQRMPEKKKKKKKALWERERDYEIARVYQGAIPFDPVSLDAWRAASASLATLGAPVLGWIHPLAEGVTGGGAFDAAVAECETADCPRILRPAASGLSAETFLNINHVAPGAGMRGLTECLIQEVVADLSQKVTA